MDSTVRRADTVPFTRLDDEMLGVDDERGYLYSMNESGGRIWELIDRPITVAQLCARLQQEYVVEEAVCQSAVLDVLARLRSAGLVEVV